MVNKNSPRHSFLYRNSLTFVFLLLLLLAWAAQAYTGWHAHNDDLKEKGASTICFLSYLLSDHFLEATFENWESEFLQMTAYVWLTVWLRQKGSAECKDLDKPEEVDREPQPHPDATWPVRKGGIWLSIYKRSLSLAFFLLFMVSFVLHFIGSRGDYNIEQMAMHKPPLTVWQNLGNNRFWSSHSRTGKASFSPLQPLFFYPFTCGKTARRNLSR